MPTRPIFIALSLLATCALQGCSLAFSSDRFDFADDGGPDGIDAGFDATVPPDSGADGGPEDGGPDLDASSDSGLDGGYDAGYDGGGGCADSTMCSTPTPFCDDIGTCVECLVSADCVDADPCTVDRCSLGACTHVAGSDCAGAITVGGSHACALRGANAWCWGRNRFGQLGDTTTTNRLTPRRISGLTTILEIAAGSAHTCARLSIGSVRCWGSNPYGQIGDDSRDQRTSPTAVVTLADAESLSAGGNHTCAVRTGGEVTCWGRNSAGQLGNGMAPTDALRPSPVDGVSDAIGVAAGFAHTCALRQTGAVLCWGSNAAGQLGNGTSSASEPTPVPVIGLTDAVGISAGVFHSCALRATGAVVCWGGNDFGQLGDGSMAASPTPSSVPSLADGVEVSTGDLHTCALGRTGRLLCWGQNANGQLGDGTTMNSALPEALGAMNFVEADGGGNFTCARRAVDIATVEVLCWGHNGSGQLGDGTMDNSLNPVAVVGI